MVVGQSKNRNYPFKAIARSLGADVLIHRNDSTWLPIEQVMHLVRQEILRYVPNPACCNASIGVQEEVSLMCDLSEVICRVYCQRSSMSNDPVLPNPQQLGEKREVSSLPVSGIGCHRVYNKVSKRSACWRPSNREPFQWSNASPR